MPRVKGAVLGVKDATISVIKGVNPINALIVGMILALLILFPPILPDYYLSIFRDVLMWMGLSVSWHFFSGYTKYISLGSAASFGIGLYFAAGSIGFLPLPVVVLLAGLVNFALALVIGLVTLRLRGIYFAILTFSVSMVVMNLVQWWEIKITGTRGTYIPVYFDSQTCYYTILGCAVVIFLLTTLLRRSKFGLGLKMIGENEEAAVHVGVNASLYKTLGFAVSAMLMGFMGASFATRLPYVSTDTAFSTIYSFYPPVMTLLGGIGTVYGPIVGSITITLLSDFLSVTLVHYFLIILGLILIAVVLVLPNGIMGIQPKKVKMQLKRLPKNTKMKLKGLAKKIRTTRLFGGKRVAKAPEKPP